jgi:dihydropteroate synthase
MPTINCKGNLIDLSTPKVMGILNVTPDSFYDGGKLKSNKEVLEKIEKMLTEGATFIDIGGYSSKPGADFVTEQEEQNRVLPIVKLALNNFPKLLISIDTFRHKIAQNCIENGAAIINDISAGIDDDKMLETIAKYNVPYIMMHKKGNAQNMQSLAYYDDIVKEINYYFSERIAKARSLGINDLIIDPGFGFAKTIAHNFELLQKLELLQFHEVPLLAGISRKSMVYKTLETTPENALNGTTFLHGFCLQKGASILRVHDVKEAVACVKLYEYLT